MLLFCFIIFIKTCDICLNTPSLPLLKYDIVDCDCVDLLIPIRNEVERGLEFNLNSIVKQSHFNVNIIAIDDRSSDGSVDVIKKVANKYKNQLTYIKGKEPPIGWMGKIYALEQGKRSASGEWIAFIDSDVFVTNDLINNALLFSKSNNIDALCVLPEFTYRSFWVGVILPSMIWLSGLRVSPSETNNNASPNAFGFGNFILVRRHVHDKIGGFDSYKSSVLDDCEIMERLKRENYNVFIADGSYYFSSHMYENLKELIAGFKKNSFAAINYNLYKLAVFILVEIVLMIAPIIAIVNKDIVVLIIYLVFVISAIMIGLKVKAPVQYYLLFPVGSIFSLIIVISSAVSKYSGFGTSWKGNKVF